MDLPEAILNALNRALQRNNDGFAALHEPCFIGNEWQYVRDCVESTWVSSVGKYVDRFEQHLAEFTGVKRAIVVVNGTAALHIALKIAGIGAGDEVLTPALTFVATANAVAYCGAVPHFIDSDEASLGVDPEKLSVHIREIGELREDGCYNRETGRRIKALIPMHTFGHPVDLDPLKEVCEKYRLIMIEDAAESIGSLYKGRHTGHWGLLSILSFNGNKIVTTGGGGAILTDSEALADEVKHVTTTAKVPHPWEYRHDRIGYNYRLPNINAALGCAQMEKLPVFLQRKRELAARYEEAFAGMSGVRFFREPSYGRSNYWLNAIILAEGCADQRDAVLAMTNRHGIMTRPSWTLMHRLPMFAECPRMNLDCAEGLERRLINIPSGASLLA